MTLINTVEVCEVCSRRAMQSFTCNHPHITTIITTTTHQTLESLLGLHNAINTIPHMRGVAIAIHVIITTTMRAIQSIESMRGGSLLVSVVVVVVLMLVG